MTDPSKQVYEVGNVVTEQDGEFTILKSCVERTIEKVYTSESYLIDHGLSEWTIAAQFHYWMRTFASKKIFGYDFDAEYNHMHLISDKEKAEKFIGINGELKSVRPDFIIHKRGDPAANILWVELKRHGGEGWRQDLNRTCAVTQTVEDRKGVEFVTGYHYGLGVLFHKKRTRCEWFRDNGFLCACDGLRDGGKVVWSIADH